MLTRLANRLDAFLTTANPWTNVYGLARTLLATSLLLTLLANESNLLFLPAAGYAAYPHCDGAAQYGLFCELANGLPAARWIGIVVLFVAASGWRPRFTALPLWYVSWSYFSSATVVDGGDQLNAILTLLLVPIAISDTRRWHWDPPETGTSPRPIHALSALLALTVVRLQVALVYFEAVAGKLRVQEWRDGTATYYYLLDPIFGAPQWLRPLAERVLASSIGVTALTWGTLVLETALFASLLAEYRYRRVLLVAGISFHAGIAMVAGLPSFSLVMTGACILYLRPVTLPFAIGLPSKWIRAWQAGWQAARRVQPVSEPGAARSLGPTVSQ